MVAPHNWNWTCYEILFMWGGNHGPQESTFVQKPDGAFDAPNVPSLWTIGDGHALTRSAARHFRPWDKREEFRTGNAEVNRSPPGEG